VTDIALVGEAWGEQENLIKEPFVGASGQELTRMLADAGIPRSDCHLTNVFNQHPPGNDIDYFFKKRLELTAPSPMPSLGSGQYLNPTYYCHLERLWAELEDVAPNLVVALGNTALWALTRQTPKITKQRGAITISQTLKTPRKILPTFHPAAVMRQWNYRVIVVADFIKALRESESPEYIRPRRRIWIQPTIEDLYLFYAQHIEKLEKDPASGLLSVDIETARQEWITCISFAPDPWNAITVPFVDQYNEDNSYWGSLEEEIQAWLWVNARLTGPSRKVGQNFLYDMQYLIRKSPFPIHVRHLVEDSMLKHHALQPEMPKALDFLGSVYTNEAAWKTMRPRGTKTEKREE